MRYYWKKIHLINTNRPLQKPTSVSMAMNEPHRTNLLQSCLGASGNGKETSSNRIKTKTALQK